MPKGRIHGCIMCEDNTLIQIISDNDHDGENSLHYEWGEILNKVCESHSINREVLWDSEKDMNYTRIKLEYKSISKN